MEPILQIQQLKKNYGSNEVLKGIDLDVYPGQIIGYIGPNGAGKSTTVKMILGLEQDYLGDISLFGKNIKDDPINYKRRVGYVPEMAELYDALTAHEYLTFIGELYGMDFETTDQKAKQLFSVFNMEHVYNARISSFSKGMKQKLLIVSSMLHNPDILFLDEPINGLDANSVMIFKEILAQLANAGKTIFYSSHIMDVVEKISTRIVIINDGQIVTDGTFSEIKQQQKDGKGSLEEIFNKVTGFNDQKQRADEFISIVTEVK
ncbi:ABC transporter ATP-binding protein [Bacillus carboniphilus]|uniref:ABC transporter ATP-binding protein n=1 Tax=Bacillus carboniphilus TaxID=86663 RepID=A0ABY9JUJ5_9BACI|nr:ABC transporter ATP-binding protein [Bacillus carboniphilus]WLR43087.1 ABC transporter ATP-binding protein [Bacillus carboniphilus]